MGKSKAGDEYYGHATMTDGTHVALSKDEAEAIWKSAMASEQRRADDMPTTLDAIRHLQDARTRLRELGWREAKYCPKDATPFAVIQYGSTGIFEAFYSGDWPEGHIYCCDYLSHPDGMLFKALDDLTDDERERLDKCMGREKANYERMITSLMDQ